jgi:phosphotransferase system  glucose/maltose/N-acetylglucosamine-specific IIC component
MLTEVKRNILSSIFDVISGTFTPILPAIARAGMIKGILAIGLSFRTCRFDYSDLHFLYFHKLQHVT